MVVALALPIAACSTKPPAPATIRLGGDTMGTRWNATIVAPGGAGASRALWIADGPGGREQAGRAPSLEAELRSLIEEALDLVDDRMSTWKADSELSRFNRHASTEPFPLSPETLTVLRLAREVSLATAGAFDVTVGPLVDAWGFGPGPDPAAVPSAETIAALRERVGFEKLALDEAAGVAVKALPGLEVDLSAIAPGYAADVIAERLRAAGFARHLIEVGGELRVAGRNPDGTLWRIAIERPQAERRETQRVLELTDVAVATSGDYRDFYELDGVRYSHTIDPATGSPVRHSLVSATVLHESCALADAWATAMMVLGPEEGLRVAEANDLPVLLMVYQDDGLLELESAALARRLGGERTAAER
jgi:thiamine biosynthesis lipoprotein